MGEYIAPRWRRVSRSLIFGVCGWLIACGSAAKSEPGSSGTLTEPSEAGVGVSTPSEIDAASNVSSDTGAGMTGVADASIANIEDVAANDVATITLPPPTASYDGEAPPPLWIADAAPVRMSNCQPGTYSGSFIMMVSFGKIHALNLKGNLSITLVANNPTPQPGEFNNGILTVAPGAMFTGKDVLGDVITADLSGQLDCGSLTFVGTLTNGACKVFGRDAALANIKVNGSMAAKYDPTTSPASLVNGTFTFTSPEVPDTTGNGMWTAPLQ